MFWVVVLGGLRTPEIEDLEGAEGVAEWKAAAQPTQGSGFDSALAGREWVSNFLASWGDFGTDMLS